MREVILVSSTHCLFVGRDVDWQAPCDSAPTAKQWHTPLWTKANARLVDRTGPEEPDGDVHDVALQAFRKETPTIRHKTQRTVDLVICRRLGKPATLTGLLSHYWRPVAYGPVNFGQIFDLFF